MAKRTLAVATWEYTIKGRDRRAYFGDVVDLPASEIKRGEAAGVFGQKEPKASPAPDPAPEPAVDDPAPEDPVDEGPVSEEGDVLEGLDDADAESGAGDAPVERPKNAAPQEDWVEFAVANGMDREEAQATDRADLIKALS